MTKFGFVLILAFAIAVPVFAGTGNLCPSNKVFGMNIIGVDNPKNPTMTGSDRKTIFIALNGHGNSASRVFLTQGDYKVCDGNAFDTAYDCNGNPISNNGSTQTRAVFRLPCNLNVPADVTCGGGGLSACYDIFVRGLG